ncbi:secretoglobin family 1D member 2 [Ictidomys tridecemlineatus]|uniref:Secretoglobin family 1D member 2-like n=1 Tax=Ictidomys tridecemlineatus TaxID=43179 RepID=A0A287CTT9_ICTTR|nr:secretoglobin family 1D member 2-like [Ictidomys tridecemlineatus]KAG3284884.1 secretoglobin family 1D member 2-like [Ictidomys tridecemlineatus]
MRLSVCVLLVTLALCCKQANGLACPTMVTELLEFLDFSPASYWLSLQKFKAPSENVDAKLEVKECTDQMSALDRNQIKAVLTEILLRKCTL